MLVDCISVFVPHTVSYTGTPASRGMVPGAGAFGRQLFHEGGAPLGGTELYPFLGLCPVRMHKKNDPV